jgi:ribonuclease J
MSNLRVLPLGGLGEFGNNLTIYEYGDDAVIIDCGTKFPEPATLGVDLIIPDMSYIFADPAKFKGVFLTHGHEDHVGAIPFLLQRVRLPIYGLPLTIGFIRDKLSEWGLADEADLRVIHARDVIEAGCMTVEPIHVTHSTVDSVSFAITTPLGVVIHTGDFKIDDTPVDGKLTDIARFKELGEQGTLLLVSDSTNILFGGHCPSECAVSPVIEGIAREAPGRVLITTFSSHIHRMQQVIGIAERLGRPAQILGRSMVRNTATAERLGYLRRRLAPWSNDAAKPLLLITGSQGEPRSALARAAVDENRSLQLGRGDTVIFSARVIPGNELSISHLIDNLYRRGAEVFAHEVPIVHASGHAYQEELKAIIELVRPRYFLPAHGTLHFLMHHAALAKSAGIPADNVAVITNGQVVEVERDGMRVAGEVVPHGKVYVDSESEELHDLVVRDRRHLSQDGFVIAVAAMGSSGVLMRAPEIITRGVLHVDTNQDVLDTLREQVVRAIEDCPLDERLDRDLLQEKIRSVLKRYFRKNYGRRPLILPVVWEM